MKVIDLLNMCANEEEVPKEIKCNDLIYEKSKYNATPRGYYRINGGIKLWLLNEIYSLNDEIEIIEDNEIKKLENINSDYYCEHNGKISNEEIILDIETLKYYINEIIDRLNGDKNDNGRI